MAMEAAEALKEAFKLAHRMYKDYSTREATLRSFAWLMQVTAGVLDGIGQVPPHAAPIVDELYALLQRASSKVRKYDERRVIMVLASMRTEKIKLADIEAQVRQLLPLLTISVASNDSAAAAALADLQRRAVSLQGECAESAHHLRHIADTVAMISRHGATAIEVRQSLTTLRDSMRALHSASTQRVLDGCAAMHEHLDSGVAKILRGLVPLQRVAAELEGVPQAIAEMLEGQGHFAATQDEMLACMELMRGQLQHLQEHFGLPPRFAEDVQSGQSLLAIMDQHSHHRGGASTSHAATLSRPPSDARWAAAMQEAVRSGRLQITACLVLGVPLMASGPLRPVTLPCCGLVVSRAGGERCARQGRCRLCNVPLPPAESVDLPDDAAVAAAVAAEELGIAPPLLDRADVALIGPPLGAGSEGTVYKGTFRGKEVAVKVVPLAAATRRPQDVASIRHVIAASFLAAIASPHVCKLHGYCWTETELWLVTELCDDTLDDLVFQAVNQSSEDPGLPPLDVVTLGLMLCCALDAVHRGARYLHLDIKPSNILIKRCIPGSTTGGSSVATATARAKLSDFGFVAHLPSHLSSSLLGSSQDASAGVSGVARGTPGYAPREQLHGSARRRSDVYSFGATLKFAATHRHPFHNAEPLAITQRLLDGQCIEVPEYIYAPLRALICRMVAMDPNDRPKLREVQAELLQMHADLVARGHTTHYLAPIAAAHMPLMHAPAAPQAAPAAADDAVTGAITIAQQTVARDPPPALADEPMHEGTPAASPSSTHSMQIAWSDLEEPLVTTQSEVCIWLTDHCPGDEVSLQQGEVEMGGGHWPPCPQNTRVVAALAAQDWIPQRTQMAIERTMVSRVSRGGGKVSDGTIRLGRAGFLLLDAACDIAFERVTFEGGTVVCYGEGSRLSLTSCRFLGCILLAIDGVHVTLDNVSFRGLRDSDLCYALTARGQNTSVSAKNLRITAWAGVLVEHGATFNGSELSMREISFAAVHVRGARTHATVTASCMRGRELRRPSAFQVAAHAHVSVHSTVITAFADGMHVMDGAFADVTECMISRCVACGVVAEGGQVSLQHVHIEYTREKGIVVAGEDGDLRAKDCLVLQPGIAVCVSKGANADLTRCILQEGLKGGLQVDGPTSLADCSECVFKANSECGVRVARGAVVHLTSCVCNDAGGQAPAPAAGVPGCGYLVQAGSWLHVKEGVCRAHGPAPACIVEAAGCIDARKVAAISGRVGLLFLSKSHGVITKCVVEACQGSGMEVLSGAAVEVAGSDFVRCGGSGVLARHESHETLREILSPQVPAIPAHGGAHVGWAGLFGSPGGGAHGASHASHDLDWAAGAAARGVATRHGPVCDAAGAGQQQCQLRVCRLLKNGGHGVSATGGHRVTMIRCEFDGNVAGASGEVCCAGRPIGGLPRAAAARSKCRGSGGGLQRNSAAGHAGELDPYSHAGSAWQAGV